MSDNMKNEYCLQEYQSLRSEKLQRYAYSSQLHERLITSSIAIWTIALALFPVLENLLADSNDDNKKSLLIPLVMLEIFQAFMISIPAWLSIFIFKAHQSNSIRIHLLSDYLRIRAKRDNIEKTWEELKQQEGDPNGLHYFYDYNLVPFGKEKDVPDSKTVGELTRIHSIVTWVSFVFSIGLMCIISKNCLSPFVEQDSGNNLNELTNWYCGCMGVICILSGIINFFTVRGVNKPESQKKIALISTIILCILIYVELCLISTSIEKDIASSIFAGFLFVSLIFIAIMLVNEVDICGKDNGKFVRFMWLNKIGVVISGIVAFVCQRIDNNISKTDDGKIIFILFAAASLYFAVSLVLVPCYGYWQSITEEIINNNRRKVNNYFLINHR